MFTDLRTWPARRRMITGGVAIVAFTGLALASGLVRVSDSGLVFPGTGWSIPAGVVGSILIGLIIASYIGTPIGADAPVRHALARLRPDRSLPRHRGQNYRAHPSGVAHPVVAVAAMVLLVWALRERLASELRTTARLGVSCRP